MTRTLTLSLLTLISLSGLSMARAESTVLAKDSVNFTTVRFERLSITQPSDEAPKGKDQAPRPKPTPGPRDGNEE